MRLRHALTGRIDEIVDSTITIRLKFNYDNQSLVVGIIGSGNAGAITIACYKIANTNSSCHGNDFAHE
jgi:hypothetical protein